VGWGRPAPTLVPWRQGFRLQQGTSVGVGLPKPSKCCFRYGDVDVVILNFGNGVIVQSKKGKKKTLELNPIALFKAM